VQVEIWSDVVCPWCYLGKRRFERALESFDHRDAVEVTYRSFELDPSADRGRTTPTIELLASKYGMTVAEATQAQQQMEQRAAEDGLEFHMDGLESGNTRDSHRLLHLAEARHRQPELVERLHQAYFSEHRSIFDHASLTELAVEAGLDRGEVNQVLAGDQFADAVEADEATARSLGATGVPFFVIDRRYGISGAQPAEAILGTLNQAWDGAEAPTRH
jgi:predicted DsbA family dithiol-disulfide isomerase